MNGTGSLGAPEPSAAAERPFADDLDTQGFVMKLSQLWARLPQADDEPPDDSERGDVQELRDAGFGDDQPPPDEC